MDVFENGSSSKIRAVHKSHSPYQSANRFIVTNIVITSLKALKLCYSHSSVTPFGRLSERFFPFQLSLAVVIHFVVAPISRVLGINFCHSSLCPNHENKFRNCDSAGHLSDSFFLLPRTFLYPYLFIQELKRIR
ncbi:hypothetical protein NPIL_202791 [Nephila pilipes]|uniref:Uncharacterized protein n=1 Tax=Nephila pilipes TaxID=299642 RepID=A0A8X6MF33_NEPPI|nr:hypothetical protein NPIL_202791 [Nephila pilipes]